MEDDRVNGRTKRGAALDLSSLKSQVFFLIPCFVGGFSIFFIFLPPAPGHFLDSILL